MRELDQVLEMKNVLGGEAFKEIIEEVERDIKINRIPVNKKTLEKDYLDIFLILVNIYERFKNNGSFETSN